MRRTIQKGKFIRSIDYQIQYYRHKSMKQRLQDTFLISELCLKLMQAGKKARFNGR